MQTDRKIATALLPFAQPSDCGGKPSLGCGFGRCPMASLFVKEVSIGGAQAL